MKSEDEIKAKIKLFEGEQATLKGRMAAYRWTDYEKINGSTYYGSLQEARSNLNRKIELLEWVLN